MNKLTHKVLLLIHDLFIISVLTIIATSVVYAFATIIYMLFGNV